MMSSMKYLCLLFTLLCLSCSSVRRTVRTVDRLTDSGRMVVHDTVRMVRYFRDSVFVRDSVYLSGGVLVKERWRDRWRVRLDTVYRVRRDTVERVREVERVSSDERRVGGVLGGVSVWGWAVLGFCVVVVCGTVGARFVLKYG